MNDLKRLSCLLAVVAAVLFAVWRGAAPGVPALAEEPGAAPQPDAQPPANAAAASDADPAELPTPINPQRLRVQYVDETPEDIAAIQAHRALLGKKIKHSDEDRTLAHAVQAIREQTGVNINVNWSALEVVGIKPSALHQLRPTELTAKQLLALLLEAVSADAFSDDKAGYAIRPGGLYISTRRDIKSKVFTRIYDIRELVRYHYIPLGMMLDDFRAADVEAFEAFLNRGRNNPLSDNRTIERQQDQITELERLLKLRAKDLAEELDLDRDRLVEAIERAIKRANKIKGGGGLFFADENADDVGDEWTIGEYINEIRDLITTTVGDPDEWLDEESIIYEQAGRLVIQTTPENHGKIERLLNGLLADYTQRHIAIVKDMRIMRLLHRAYEASLDGQLDLAMDLVNEARRIDPHDAPAFAMQVMVQDQQRRNVDPDAMARRRLVRKISVSEDRPPLRKALQQIADKTNSDFVVRWEGIEDVELLPSHPVGFVHVSRQGNEVLREVLDAVSQNLPARDKLDYAIRGGKVVIDTRSNLSR